MLPLAVACFLMAGAVAASFLAADAAGPVAVIATFVLMLAAQLRFPACPRCGLNVFVTLRDKRRFFSGSYFLSVMHRHVYSPNRLCSRCGLDLRAFTLFDSRAKRGT